MVHTDRLTAADHKLYLRIKARADAEADPTVKLSELDPLRVRQDRDELLRMLDRVLAWK